MRSWPSHRRLDGVVDPMTRERVSIERRLDLEEFFSRVKADPYVVVRGDPDSLPDYAPGSDLDIFCYDKEAFGRQVLAFANPYVERAGCEVRVRDSASTNQTHIDLLWDGNLELRFDLYGEFPAYRRCNINPALFLSVIEHAESREVKIEGASLSIQVPGAVDDLLLRYIEYIEYYEERPDKVRHLEYILAVVDRLPEARIGFLEKLHRYTSLPTSTPYVPSGAPADPTLEDYLRPRLRRWKRRAKAIASWLLRGLTLVRRRRQGKALSGDVDRIGQVL